MQSFKYQRVHSLQEALDAFSASKGPSAFMAGGTDLLVHIKEGKRQPQRIIDLKGIDEINGLTLSDNHLLIGALTSIEKLATSPLTIEKFPLLVESASQLGSVQVRHRATIGGNLCNASPSADMAPALLALDAQAMIQGKAGMRVVDLVEFFIEPGKTVLNEGELLTHLKVPLIQNHQVSVYYKLSTRKAMDLAFVGVAVLLELGKGDQISKARIALGAVAPTAIRVPSAEKLLEGKVLSLETARESAELAAQSCKPISDYRASAEYRREMVQKICLQSLLGVYRQATGSLEKKNK